MSEDVCEFCHKEPAVFEVSLKLEDKDGNVFQLRPQLTCLSCWTKALEALEEEAELASKEEGGES